MMKTYNFNEMVDNLELYFHIGTANLDKDFPVHTHDFSELVIITEGSCDHQIDDDLYPVKAGDVYVIKGNTPHGFKNVNNLKLYNIMYIPDKIFLQYSSLKKMAGFLALLIFEPFYRHEHDFQSRLILNDKELNFVENILLTMINETGEQKNGYKSLLRSYLSILFVHLARIYKISDGNLSKKIFRIAESIIYIENNYTEKINLEYLAQKANLSRRHFTRIFKQNFNISPYEYVINLRIDYACRLLKNTELTITQIALKSGFVDPNYFSRLFKKKIGVTPTNFRKYE